MPRRQVGARYRCPAAAVDVAAVAVVPLLQSPLAPPIAPCSPHARSCLRRRCCSSTMCQRSRVNCLAVCLAAACLCTCRRQRTFAAAACNSLPPVGSWCRVRCPCLLSLLPFVDTAAAWTALGASQESACVVRHSQHSNLQAPTRARDESAAHVPTAAAGGPRRGVPTHKRIYYASLAVSSFALRPQPAARACAGAACTLVRGRAHAALP